MTQCRYPGCESTSSSASSSNAKPSFHVVPRDQEAIIAKILKTKDVPRAHRLIICGIHFREGSFIEKHAKNGRLVRHLRNDVPFIQLLKFPSFDLTPNPVARVSQETQTDAQTEVGATKSPSEQVTQPKEEPKLVPEVEAANARIQQLQSDLNISQRKVKEYKSRHDEVRSRLNQKDLDLSRTINVISAMKAIIVGYRGEMHKCKVRIAELEDQLKAARQELSERSHVFMEHDDHIAKLKEELFETSQRAPFALDSTNNMQNPSFVSEADEAALRLPVKRQRLEADLPDVAASACESGMLSEWLEDSKSVDAIEKILNSSSF